MFERGQETQEVMSQDKSTGLQLFFAFSYARKQSEKASTGWSTWHNCRALLRGPGLTPLQSLSLEWG